MIQQFYKQAVSKDFARLFQFRVTAFPGIQFDPTSHLLYAETATLPGRAINNIPVPYMGLSFNVPGTASYPGSANYAIQFRIDETYDIRAALETSLFNTFDDSSSTGQYKIKGSDRYLELSLLGKGTVGSAGGAATEQVVRIYKLYGAYLVSTNDTAYDIKDTGTVSTCTATIAYHFWRAGADTGSLVPEGSTGVRQTFGGTPIIQGQGTAPAPTTTPG